MSLTEKGKWKYISIEKRYFEDNAFDGFGSIQVLNDYVYTRDGQIEKAATAPLKRKDPDAQTTSGKANVDEKPTKNRRKKHRKEKGCGNNKTDNGSSTKKRNPEKIYSNLKTSEVIESTNNKTSGSNDVLDLPAVKLNVLKRKKLNRNTRKAAAIARKKEANAHGIYTTGKGNGSIKYNRDLTSQVIDASDNTANEILDPATIKANRLERKKIKRKAKKAAAIARKKEAAAQGIDLKEIKKANENTVKTNNSPISPAQPSEKKLITPQQKKNKKLAQQNRRTTVQSNIIDITDIEKHVDADKLEIADKSRTKKRKIEDVEAKNKKSKTKKKTGKVENTDGIKSKSPEEKILPEKKSMGSVKSMDMSKWKDLFVPEVVLKALSEVGFDTPTPIQCLTLPSAIRDRKDILGAAETGSGKTLAFGIPVIHNILQYNESHPDDASDSDDNSEDDWSSDGERMEDEGGKDDGEMGEGEDGDSDGDFGEAEIWGGSDSDESEAGEDGHGESSSDDQSEDYQSGGGYDHSDDQVEDGDDEGGVEEESDDGGEYDLAPEEGEEYFELKDGELGCLAAVNNVSFDWMEEDSTQRTAGNSCGRPLHCLILTPTRELAIQIKNHLQTACTYTEIKICCVVGGMASQKQERLLRKCPEIVVATPGRFWELLQQGEPHLAKVDRLRALVIDEADRMVEKGHFEEMKNFMEFLKENEKNRRRRQNFVFSATLTMVHKAPTRLLLKKKKVKQETTDDKLQSLVDMIGLDPKAKVIDITRKLGTAASLVESKINCTSDEKDIYLYYFLQRYPGRTLVFSNSKDCLRRLVSVFTLLECRPLPLHADMQQRQRLKNLDKFKADPAGLLLATDVAARGLDIPNVEHVIHYQVPRTSENYVHRSGRTARASREGLSVVLIGQEDMTNYRKITRTLNRSEELGVFPVEQEFMVSMRQRVALAWKIDKEEHRHIKNKKQNEWFEKAAKEMDIELDEEGLLNDLGDSQQQAQQKLRLVSMRRDLRTLLSQPVIPRAFSGCYPTKMGKLDMPLNTEHGDACAAARKEAKANSRFNIFNTEASKTAKKASKKKYKRKK